MSDRGAANAGHAALASPRQSLPRQPRAPHLAIDLEGERDQIRCSLSFRHIALAGKGRAKEFSLSAWDASPFRQIVEELLIAYAEISAKLRASTVQGDVFHLQQFFHFLADADAPHARDHNPRTTKELSFALVRDFEHWLAHRPKILPSKVAERAEALRTHLETHELPRQRYRKSTVHFSALNQWLGAPFGYIQRHPVLMDIVRTAAERQGLLVRESRTLPRSAARKSDGTKRLTAKFVEDIYYTLAKTLRHIKRHRGHLLADDFVLPALSDPDRHPRGVKSHALTPTEFERFRAACLAAAKRVKSRLLVEGPARAARGRPDPDGEPAHIWGKELDNLVAYQAKYAPGQIISPRDRSLHRRFLNAFFRGPESTTTVARWLSPGSHDLTPFVLAIGSSEFAPLNLSSVIDLWVDEANPERHCVRDDSPTPGHKRVYFAKPRAGIDQTWIDVPARSALDIPGLIETVVEFTRPLRAQAPPEVRDHLWLYLSGRHGVRALVASYVTTWLVRQFIAQENVRGDDGELLRNMHYLRLRPTVIGNLAFDKGLEAAQTRAAHADPIQTLAYVNNPGNDSRVRSTVTAAQSKAIAAIRAGFRDRPSPEEVRTLARDLGVADGRAAEIIIGRRDKLFNACIDDKNGRGPEIAGRRCGKFEACLVCMNSVILERHLPRLIAYYLHWLAMADSMDEEAWRENHELNCAIVEVHLRKFDSALVARLMEEIRANPQPIAHRRFKQS